MPAPYHGYVDESIRGSIYMMGCARVCADDVSQLRRTVHGLREARTRRMHFNNERAAARKPILDALVDSGLISYLVVTAKVEGRDGDQVARDRCLTELVATCIDRSVTRLVIESREGQDHRDRRTIARAVGRQRSLEFDHLPGPSEACLWVPDALTWAYGRGGTWRSVVQPLVIHERALGPPP